MASARHAQRAERILDAAAELVLRWGYKRVTIEDVAKRAGIGKGTVYLHFSTRAALFVAVLIRESLAMVSRDIDVLGDLAHEAAIEPLRALKTDFAGELFALLRAHGLLRTDLDIDTQRYVLDAVQTGFYLAEPLMAMPARPHAAADALTHTIRLAVQSPQPPDPDTLAGLAPKVIAMYEQFRGALATAALGDPPEGE